MAITYPLTLPTVTGVQSVNFIARNSVGTTASPFTYEQQVFKNVGQRFEADITLPPMSRADAEVWNTFFIKLYGQYGTFLLGDPNSATPRGTASSSAGTPVVNGASQTGNTLICDGAPNSKTGYLKAGDYIQLGTGSTSKLHMVVADSNSDGSGNFTLSIEPALRESPAENLAITVANTKGVFRLATNETNWDTNAVSTYGITFAVREVL